MSENESFFAALTWLLKEKFDTRKWIYENETAYRTRIITAYNVHNFNYAKTQWSPLEEFAEICPTSKDVRLPSDKKKLGNHSCFYLQLRDVKPENWLVPVRRLDTCIAAELPTRATYRAQKGDILLSRFKEPLGKCVVYDGEARLPLYINSNYLLLRPRSSFSPELLLGLLKSPFVTCQLHQIIQPRSVITEMFINEAHQIRLPNLTSNHVQNIERLAKQRIQLEEQNKKLAGSKGWEGESSDDNEAFETLSDIDMKIIETILSGI